jgi:hypothetical protein
VSSRPRKDPIHEAHRIADAADSRKLKVKLLGGAGVHVHSPSAHRPPLRRAYGDLDYAIPSRERKAVLELFPSLGYEPNERFNVMQGDRRLYFYDTDNGRQVDVFVDVFRMSHAIDLRGRLEHTGPAATPSDLLLSKLQIFEVNQKDLVDVTALILDHPIANDADDSIDAAYVARLACEDWGLCRTIQLNLAKLRHAVLELDVDRDLVDARIDQLWAAVQGGPKPLRWRLRAQVGDRVRWYELPEEIRSPYQPG